MAAEHIVANLKMEKVEVVMVAAEKNEDGGGDGGGDKLFLLLFSVFSFNLFNLFCMRKCSQGSPGAFLLSN